ncbi:MAG: hypothetical protein ACR2KX_14620 [Chitinophagaceae bacterium]
MLSKKVCILFFISICIKKDVPAQNDSAVFATYTTLAHQTKIYNTLTSLIKKNLSIPLNDVTEEKWSDVFWAMELINYKSLWVNNRIHYAFDSILNRGSDFQRGFLELIYTNYPKQFSKEVSGLITQISQPKIFAMCSEYLLQNNSDNQTRSFIINLLKKTFGNNSEDAILQSLTKRLQQNNVNTAYKILPDIFSKEFLAGNVIMYSIQRKKRDYPGIVIIRDKQGNFIRENNGKVFNVPQLARSITNLPGYLTNGNTPQGIFRMYGFDVSASNFIGPTTNVQLTMPVETSLQHFLKDTTISDSVWTLKWYKKLLPEKIKNYSPLYESFYAGKAGRTEIIAHGTTINPDYYKNKPYYPHTPSQGCLCTKESWSPVNGKRLQSDQQKLVDALNIAGGPDGYTVVIELDDKSQAVKFNDILPFILKAESLK